MVPTMHFFHKLYSGGQVVMADSGEPSALSESSYLGANTPCPPPTTTQKFPGAFL